MDSGHHSPATVTLTPALIHAGRSGRGGWNMAQLEAIGIVWEELKRSGWIDRAAGRVVTAEAYQRFLSLAGRVGCKREPPSRPSLPGLTAWDVYMAEYRERKRR